MQELAGDVDIAIVTTLPNPYPDGMAQTWIATHAEEFAARKSVNFAISLRTDEQWVIGTVRLSDILPDHKAELGYWIGKRYWGHGYATEAVRAVSAVLQYAFQELSVERIWACVGPCHAEGRNAARGEHAQAREKMGKSGKC